MPMILSDFLKKISFIFICNAFFVSVGSYAHDQESSSDEKLALDLNILFEKQEVVQPDLTAPSTKEDQTVDLSDIYFPGKIYKKLTEYTVGQDEAMQSLATFIHEHLVNMRLREAALKNPENPLFQELALEKPNILMMGPTGCGKTSSLTVLSQFLKVPLAVGNATEWTSQGYIGGKWQEVFEKLVLNSRSLLQKEGREFSKEAVKKAAEHGIVFIDEIDKICVTSSGDLDVINRVQQELLPVIQGMELMLNSGEILNTSNILFIAGGAFPGLIPSSVNKSKQWTITPQKLESYGMLPELAGRLCNIVQFSALNKEGLKQIILTSKNSPLHQFIKKYELAYGIKLTFTPAAIDYIAEIASHQKTGARAINAMIFKLLKDKTFNIENYIGKPLSIDKETAVKVLEGYSKGAEEERNPSLAMMYL